MCLFSIAIIPENWCLAQSYGLVVNSFRNHDENNWSLHRFSDEDNAENVSTFCP
jgi:hypothetical protein